MTGLSEQEQRVWVLDQIINNRGVPVDVPTIEKAIDLAEKAKADLNARMKAINGIHASQVAALTMWIEGQGYPIKSLAKTTMLEALDDDACPDQVKDAIQVRLEFAKASTAKLQAMIDGADDDGRIRGTMQYHGAHTGRWAGRRIQPQNLPRPTMSQEEIEEAVEKISRGDTDFDNPMEVLSNCIRAMIKAPPGHEFVAVDFSSVEARVLAWLANEAEPLSVFENGGDIYLHAASNIYGRPITKSDKEERQIGKVSTLALGYAGGVGAFQNMARVYGVKVTDKRADGIKKAWRKAHPNIVAFWQQLEDAAVYATEHKGEVVTANQYIAFRRNGSFLQCRLPSGRKISYPYPKVITCGYFMDGDKVRKVMPADMPRNTRWLKEEAEGNTWQKATLFHMHRDNAAFSHRSTYGGSLCENVVQAVARDLLVEAMFRFESAGYPVVLHVHDEVVLEVPKGSLPVEVAEGIMKQLPHWAQGCPIDAEGWVNERFRK